MSTNSDAQQTEALTPEKESEVSSTPLEVTPEVTVQSGRFQKILQSGANVRAQSLDQGFWKRFKWFILANTAVVISITICSMGIALAFAPIVIVWGAAFPFIALLLSKWLAKRAHKITIINQDTKDRDDRELLELVDALRKRAGLDVMPEVGVFESRDMNAFATGAGKNNALVAFSSKLLDKMEPSEIAAVAAHEIAHIANGDMITMSIVQAVVNSVVLLISIPLSFAKLLVLFSKDPEDNFTYPIIAAIKFFVVTVLLFLGNLVVKAFSRHREYEADKLAAELVDRESMVSALKRLNDDLENVVIDDRSKAYASMKISSPFSSFGELFSTHPRIEKRIAALNTSSGEKVAE